ncbi:hypothetical protein [Methylopila turkensis]|uniref:Sulfotransferase family protein n=1 Tax=Methylopila turkensis TaxID=1437816 RepID=A0A9W6JT76_9HYPH|nr:hypothetical protein [Methylopila turkensis]GLK81869.1 hypothetical protein GCM10008174_36100 [Methylopila turkensis]
MIFSIHIPKTAGTSFRNALQARYGDRLALYYGPNDPATHPLLRRASRKSLAAHVPRLEDHGIEVLHGHYVLPLVETAVTDPSKQLWTWLRDPVERIISHYSYIRERPTKWSFDEEIKAGELSLLKFSAMRRFRNLHSQYLRGIDIEEFGFVGLSERFELGLGMLFGEDAPQLPRRYNATDDKLEADEATRDRIHALNLDDYKLYGRAARTLIDRVAASRDIVTPARPDKAGASLVKRLIRKVQ